MPIRGYKMESFNGSTLETVGKQIRFVMESVNRYFPIFRIEMFRNAADADGFFDGKLNVMIRLFVGGRKIESASRSSAASQSSECQHSCHGRGAFHPVIQSYSDPPIPEQRFHVMKDTGIAV